MHDVQELQRRPAPAGRPQPLAFYDGKLWVGCWDVNKLYAIDPATWDIVEDVDAPGRPYGLAPFGDGISVVVALDDDDRYLFRFRPGRGFDAASKRPCPEVTGSHLATDGTTLYLCQLGKKRIVALDERGEIAREIALPTRCGGFAFDGTGRAYIIAADEEFEQLEFAHIDVRQSAPEVDVVAAMPFDGRALAFDGTNWWSSVREAGEIAAFRPDGDPTAS